MALSAPHIGYAPDHDFDEEYNANNYWITENASSVTVDVTNDTYSPPWTPLVLFSTAAGTAKPSSDYQTKAGAVILSNSSMFKIPIVNDAAAESQESFKVAMVSAVGNVKRNVTINVIDDDRMLNYDWDTKSLTVRADTENDNEVVTLDVEGSNKKIDINGQVSLLPVSWLKSLNIKTGAGADTINILATPAGIPTNVYGESGTDTINVGSPDEMFANYVALDRINGPLLVGNDGDLFLDTPGSDVLHLNDFGLGGGHSYTLGPGTLSRGGAATISFSRLSKMILHCGENAGKVMVAGKPNIPIWIKGAGSADTVVGPDLENTWDIHWKVKDYSNSLSFSKIEHLTGGAGNDKFVFETQYTYGFPTSPGVTGAIQGTGGTNTLDYQTHQSGAIVNLKTGTATGVTGGMTGIKDVYGSPFHDLLVGNDDANVLWGRDGFDVIIGGKGADQNYAGGGDDLLIGGSTTHDQNAVALLTILAEWKQTNVAITSRILQLRNGVGPNQTIKLNASTVLDDQVKDELYVELGQNWFWAVPPQDVIPNLNGQQVN